MESETEDESDGDDQAEDGWGLEGGGGGGGGGGGMRTAAGARVKDLKKKKKNPLTSEALEEVDKEYVVYLCCKLLFT